MPDTVLRESAKQAVRRLMAELEARADELCYADPAPLLSAPTARLARAVLLVLPVLILDALLLSGMEGAWRFTPQNFVRLDLKGKTLTRYRHGQETERLQLDGQYGLYHVPAGRLYGGGYIALNHAAAGEKGRLLDHRHISPLFAGSRADKRLCRLFGERMGLPSRPD